MKTIIDVSSVVYSGHNGQDRRLRGFPIGGIRKLFGLINSGLSYTDFALCFDGGKIIKKELLPTYKAGRVPDYSVIAQIAMIKELLEDCNIPYLFNEQYEADDLIYTLCADMIDIGDIDDVEIFTDDRDLSCCVTNNISIKSVSSNGMCISRDSFSDRVVRGQRIPYNTILLWKIFHGDASDNYKALHISGADFWTMAKEYSETISNLISPTGLTELAWAEYDVFCAFLEDYKSLISESDMERILKQARIAYPYRVSFDNYTVEGLRKSLAEGKSMLKVEHEDLHFFGSGTFNKKKFEFYCSCMGLNKTQYGKQVDMDSPQAQEFLTKLELHAKDLASGALAVNYHRKRKQEPSGGATLANMELPD